MMLRFLFLTSLVTTARSQCTLCPDGNVPVLPVDVVLASTCQQVIELIPDLDSDSCNTIQQGDYPKLCGCFEGTSFSCNVCSDGSPPNPYGDANIATCNTIKFAALFSTSEEACSANLARYASHVDIQSVCGCPGTPVPCTICADGDSVGNPSQPIGKFNTCGGYDTFLRTFALDSPECAGKQESGLASFCGCPGTSKPCSICSGGVARGEARVPGLEGHCKNADDLALFWDVNSCDANRNSYDEWACGCPDGVPECTLCEDGSAFDLNRPSNFTRLGGTCALDQYSLQEFVELDCRAAQATAGRDCGCPESATLYCHICGPGVPLPDPSIYVDSFAHTCGFIEYFATMEQNSGSKSCSFYRGEYRGICCDGESDPYPPRPIAPYAAPTVNEAASSPTVSTIPTSTTPSPVVRVSGTTDPVTPIVVTVPPVTLPPVTPAPITRAPIVTISPLASATTSGCKVCLNGGHPRHPRVWIGGTDGFYCMDMYRYALNFPPDSEKCIAMQAPESQLKCGCPSL